MAEAKASYAFERMKALAKSYPDAVEEFPWGESAIKVRGKVFLFTRNDASGFAFTVKLPASRYFALDYSFTRPAGYGLGKSGWITATFLPTDTPPLDVLEAWLKESYNAVAPKKLVARIGGA